MFYIQDPKFWFYRSPVPPLPSAPPLPSPQWSSSSKCSCTMQDESKVCKSHFIWTSESRLSELILLDGQESLKCEPSHWINGSHRTNSTTTLQDYSRPFEMNLSRKYAWTKVIQNHLHYLLSVEMPEEWWEWLSVICVFVKGSLLLRSWEINSAYGLTVQSGRV